MTSMLRYHQQHTKNCGIQRQKRHKMRDMKRFHLIWVVDDELWNWLKKKITQFSLANLAQLCNGSGKVVTRETIYILVIIVMWKTSTHSSSRAYVLNKKWPNRLISSTIKNVNDVRKRISVRSFSLLIDIRSFGVSPGHWAATPRNNRPLVLRSSSLGVCCWGQGGKSRKMILIYFLSMSIVAAHPVSKKKTSFAINNMCVGANICWFFSWFIQPLPVCLFPLIKLFSSLFGLW